LRPPGARARRGVGQAALLGTANPAGAAVGIADGLLQMGNLIDNMITNSGCGATCIQATNVVNQVGNLMLQNLQAYLATPLPHTYANQQAALANFTALWNALDTACSSPSLGTPGANCISQRMEGACSYHTSPGGWQQTNGTWNYVYPGANGSGSTCWNYWVAFYDPIANDPTVQGDSALNTVTNTISSLTGGAGSSVSSTSAYGCFSLLTPFGIPDPCIAGIPIGLGTAAGIAILLAVLL
jgi:hypothetical protein